MVVMHLIPTTIKIQFKMMNKYSLHRFSLVFINHKIILVLQSRCVSLNDCDELSSAPSQIIKLLDVHVRMTRTFQSSWSIGMILSNHNKCRIDERTHNICMFVLIRRSSVKGYPNIMKWKILTKFIILMLRIHA